jgi:hypothetical protein
MSSRRDSYRNSFRNLRDKSSFGDDDWDDYAHALITSHDADVFAKALDHIGWQIVPKDEYAHMGARWRRQRR